MDVTSKLLKRAYYLWIKSQPCVSCGHIPSDPSSMNEADHVSIPTDRGGRMRSHKGRYAYAALPLCPSCHRKRHTMGERDFYLQSGVEPEEALVYHLTSFLYDLEREGVCGLLRRFFFDDECYMLEEGKK